MNGSFEYFHFTFKRPQHTPSIVMWLQIFVTQDGSTALMLAAAHGFPSMVTLLVGHNADVNHLNHVRHSSHVCENIVVTMELRNHSHSALSRHYIQLQFRVNAQLLCWLLPQATFRSCSCCWTVRQTSTHPIRWGHKMIFCSMQAIDMIQ